MREFLSARRRAISPPSPASSMTSRIVFSKKLDAMPVAPTEPISSLSTRMVTAVRLGSLTASCASRLGQAQTLSSWP